MYLSSSLGLTSRTENDHGITRQSIPFVAESFTNVDTKSNLTPLNIKDNDNSKKDEFSYPTSSNEFYLSLKL